MVLNCTTVDEYTTIQPIEHNVYSVSNFQFFQMICDFLDQNSTLVHDYPAMCKIPQILILESCRATKYK